MCFDDWTPCGFITPEPRKRPKPSYIRFEADLPQSILDRVVLRYNEQGPHRSKGRVTPRTAYDARGKATAHTLINQPHHRLRKDVVDPWGNITLRYRGRMLHVRIGHHHRGKRVRPYIVDDHIRVLDDDGNFLGEITINPEKNYQTMAKPKES